MILPSSFSLHCIASHRITEPKNINSSNHLYANATILCACLYISFTLIKAEMKTKMQIAYVFSCTVPVIELYQWIDVLKNRFEWRCCSWRLVYFVFITKTYFPFELKNHITIINIITIAIISNGSNQCIVLMNVIGQCMIIRSPFFLHIFIHFLIKYC